MEQTRVEAWLEGIRSLTGEQRGLGFRRLAGEGSDAMQRSPRRFAGDIGFLRRRRSTNRSGSQARHRESLALKRLQNKGFIAVDDPR